MDVNNLQAKILVISDTHWYSAEYIPDALLQMLPNFDAVIHAGDWSSYEAMQFISNRTQLFTVRGNCDDDLVRRAAPEKSSFTICGHNIGLIHGRRKSESYLYELSSAFPDEEIVIFGHMHLPIHEQIAGKQLFNPGSFSFPRGGYPPSYGILTFGAALPELQHCFF